MAALLIGMSVMAIVMSAAMPVWSTMAKREREEELIWRGQQYARAVGLFQRKFANTFPPSVDMLVEQRFLRKKYQDPITKDDFEVIPAGGIAPGGTQPGGGRGPDSQPGGGRGPAAGGRGGSSAVGEPATGGPAFGAPSAGAPAFGQPSVGTTPFGGGASQSARTPPFVPSGQAGAPGGIIGGGVEGIPAPFPEGPLRSFRTNQGVANASGGGIGIQGVVSKSDATSQRMYNGRTKYNEWAFVHLASSRRIGPGGGVPGAPGPGGPGGQRPGESGPGAAERLFNPQGGGQRRPDLPPGFGQPGTNPFGTPQSPPRRPG